MFRQGSFLHIVALGCCTTFFVSSHSHYHHMLSQVHTDSKIPRTPILQPQLRKHKLYVRVSSITISLTAALLIAALIFSVVARTRGSPTTRNYSIAWSCPGRSSSTTSLAAWRPTSPGGPDPINSCKVCFLSNQSLCKKTYDSTVCCRMMCLCSSQGTVDLHLQGQGCHKLWILILILIHKSCCMWTRIPMHPIHHSTLKIWR